MTTPQQLQKRAAADRDQVRSAQVQRNQAGVDVAATLITGAESPRGKGVLASRLPRAIARMIHALAVSGQTREVPGHQPLIGPNGNTLWVSTSGPTPGTSFHSTGLHRSSGGVR